MDLMKERIGRRPFSVSGSALRFEGAFILSAEYMYGMLLVHACYPLFFFFFFFFFFFCFFVSRSYSGYHLLF